MVAGGTIIIPNAINTLAIAGRFAGAELLQLERQNDT